MPFDIRDIEHLADSDVLSFEAPFLIDKLIQDGIADSVMESVALFTEVKRYLLLGQRHFDLTFAMYSSRIDAAWHTFVLFTKEYAQFCQRYFGLFLHHIPNAELPNESMPRRQADFDQFCSAYESLFREKVPDLWRDHTSMTLHRRLVNDSVGLLRVEMVGDDAMLIGPQGVCLMTVNELAKPAMQFIVETPHFYVRELPGELTNDEKLGLGEILVKQRILRVA